MLSDEEGEMQKNTQMATSVQELKHDMELEIQVPIKPECSVCSVRSDIFCLGKNETPQKIK